MSSAGEKSRPGPDCGGGNRMLSVLCNLTMAVLAAVAGMAHTRKAPLRVILRFFTAQSNLLCALAAVAVAVCRLCGEVPAAILVFKYIGTASVTVTFLTVMVFLGPTLGYGKLLTGPDLFLHLVCPLLALISYFVWDKPAVPWTVVLLGVLPVVLYAALYLYKVLLAPEEKRWDDFYGFNRSGKWPVSLAAMLLGTLLISVVLWLL